MKPHGGLMKFHVGFMGGPHEASWGSHEAAWGVHENLTGVSWGPQGLKKLHGDSWEPYKGVMGAS